MQALASPLKSWPVSSLPRLTGISLFEKPAHSGMSGSEAMSLSMIHFDHGQVAGGARTDDGLFLHARVARRTRCASGAKPPSSVQRVMMSFEQAHCMKSQAASMFFEYFDRPRIEPPWWA